MSKRVFVSSHRRERSGLIVLLALIGCLGSAAVGYAAAVVANTSAATEQVSSE